jgi:hypothetical protein
MIVSGLLHSVQIPTIKIGARGLSDYFFPLDYKAYFPHLMIKLIQQCA